MGMSLLVLLVLPLATVGGIIALRLLNLVTFQPMDLLTMIGFIILLGLVENNAILLVYQPAAAEREGEVRRVAVELAVRLRLRPILMTTLTSVFGMLPLVLLPGAGTELYRGLAGVIVGVVRYIKVALDRGMGCVLESPCMYFAKHPHKQLPDTIEREMLEEFIAGKRDK